MLTRFTLLKDDLMIQNWSCNEEDHAGKIRCTYSLKQLKIIELIVCFKKLNFDNLCCCFCFWWYCYSYFNYIQLSSQQYRLLVYIVLNIHVHSQQEVFILNELLSSAELFLATIGINFKLFYIATFDIIWVIAAAAIKWVVPQHYTNYEIAARLIVVYCVIVFNVIVSALILWTKKSITSRPKQFEQSH